VIVVTITSHGEIHVTSVGHQNQVVEEEVVEDVAEAASAVDAVVATGLTGEVAEVVVVDMAVTVMEVAEEASEVAVEGIEIEEAEVDMTGTVVVTEETAGQGLIKQASVLMGSECFCIFHLIITNNCQC